MRRTLIAAWFVIMTILAANSPVGAGTPGSDPVATCAALGYGGGQKFAPATEPALFSQEDTAFTVPPAPMGWTWTVARVSSAGEDGPWVPVSPGDVLLSPSFNAQGVRQRISHVIICKTLGTTSTTTTTVPATTTTAVTTSTTSPTTTTTTVPDTTTSTTTSEPTTTSSTVPSSTTSPTVPDDSSTTSTSSLPGTTTDPATTTTLSSGESTTTTSVPSSTTSPGATTTPPTTLPSGSSTTLPPLPATGSDTSGTIAALALGTAAVGAATLILARRRVS